MQKIIYTALIFLITQHTRAQKATPIILNTAGSIGVVNNITFEFNLGESATTTIANGRIITQGLLQPFIESPNIPLPIVGLQFSAKRLNNQQVQLEWSSLQEANNKGFYVERKKAADNSFVAMSFVATKAIGGNSSFPLSYMQLDTNSYVGKTYYRLRQEDLDGKTSYSTIQMIDGAENEGIKLKAWPIPAPKNFSVVVEGVDKDILQLFDLMGRLQIELPISNGTPIKISGLKPGTYIIKLKNHPDLSQKILML